MVAPSNSVLIDFGLVFSFAATGLFLLRVIGPTSPSKPSTTWVSVSFCFNPQPPKDGYDFQTATLLSVYLWSRITNARVLVSVAYMPERTAQEELNLFHERLSRLGVEVRLFPIGDDDVCDCVSLALWLRNLAYQDPMIKEDDLMMISESDVFITTDLVLKPLDNLSFKAWVYWVEPALYGGETFAMSFTTLRKEDWRELLDNSSTCQQALERFPRISQVKTLQFAEKSFGKHWESDQDVVTARLLRLGICTVPKDNRLSKLFLTDSKVKLGSWDGDRCYKAQGFGECRQLNFGNRWYKGMGDCPWWHHWYPIELFKDIVERAGEEWVFSWFIDISGKETIFF